MMSNSGVLYVGFTNNLNRRIYEHREKIGESFSMKYNCNKLMYFEEYPVAYMAIGREKQIKKWRREKKLNLIKRFNPKFKDLSDNE